MIRDWRARLLHKGTSVSETAKAYRFVRAVLMTAADDRIIARNPCRVRGAGEEKPDERPTLTVRQVYELADRMPGDCKRVLVMLAAFASLRWGEISALRHRHRVRDGDRHPAARPTGYRRPGGEPAQVPGWLAHGGDPARDSSGNPCSPRRLRRAGPRFADLHRHPRWRATSLQLPPSGEVVRGRRRDRRAWSAFSRLAPYRELAGGGNRRKPPRPHGPDGPRQRPRRADLPAQDRRRWPGDR